MIGTPQHGQWVSGSDFRSAQCDAPTADGWNLGQVGQAPNVNVVLASTVVTWLRREE